MIWLKNFPVLFVDNDLNTNSAAGKALAEINNILAEEDFSCLDANTATDGIDMFNSRTQISCVVADWDLENASSIIEFIRTKNTKIPVFIITDRHTVKDIPVEVLNKIQGYFWLMEDTPHFIAGKIEYAAKKYLNSLLPPFFKELMTYTYEYKYSWHTPGHSGGQAFLKSPAGSIFHNFFGENTLRSDLSVSVPELGSLMEHSGVVGDAEQQAAKSFGADNSYFVTNGTSTSNKIVWHGSVSPGYIVLVDRNCHKSIMHAIIMTGAVPCYFIPTRNDLGIIGPIHENEFNLETINQKIANNPLIKNSGKKDIRLAVVTNSTYDGLCYNTLIIKDRLKNQVENLHFDEAWYGYAHFHELYNHRHAMCDSHNPKDHPATFATQSTHKLLAAFSQASMVHVKSGRRQVPFDQFNEAFMMHTSTSPQYGIIASLDVATKMLEGASGKALIEDSMEEAILFRKKMIQISKTHGKKTNKSERWWFEAWQHNKTVEKNSDHELKTNASNWLLKPKEEWHGFEGMEKNYIMLDPIKVTIITPGIDDNGEMADFGIPASIISRFLWSKGVVVEKTGFYSFLVLFSIGITKGKSGTLIAELSEFKRLYDNDALLDEVFPELVKQYPNLYQNVRLKSFCKKMHSYLKQEKITQLMKDVYATLPEPVMVPAQAYKHVIHGNVEHVPISQLKGKIASVMIAPYPPGIPVIMPGEKFTAETQQIIDALILYEDIDNRFPGFENEIHGINIKEKDGQKKYYMYCVK